MPAKPGDDPRRKTYVLTDQGGSVLAQEARAMRQRLEAAAPWVLDPRQEKA